MAQEKIFSVNINNDGCFVVCTDNGLRLFNVDPYMELVHLDKSLVGSVSMCEMLDRTNFLAVVEAENDRNKRFAAYRVKLWDDSLKKFISSFTFGSKVLSMKLKQYRLYVVEKNEINIFSVPENPKKIHTFTTVDNPRGICAVSPYSTSQNDLLVYPGCSEGKIEIIDLAQIQPNTSPAPVNIKAHQSDIANISINHQGTLIATASIKGTLIRVFDVDKKSQLIELRRGLESACLYCINFSKDSKFLCASSSNGTVHIFSLRDPQLNRTSLLSSAAWWFSSYLDSQWAMATFTVTEDCKCICDFESNSSVYAVCADGTFHKYAFTNEGRCNREAYDVFLNLHDDDNF